MQNKSCGCFQGFLKYSPNGFPLVFWYFKGFNKRPLVWNGLNVYLASGMKFHQDIYCSMLSLPENYPNTEFFLVRISPHLDWIRRFTSTSPYSVRLRENTNQKKLRIWTLFNTVLLRKQKYFLMVTLLLYHVQLLQIPEIKEITFVYLWIDSSKLLHWIKLL